MNMFENCWLTQLKYLKQAQISNYTLEPTKKRKPNILKATSQPKLAYNNGCGNPWFCLNGIAISQVSRDLARSKTYFLFFR